MNLYFIGRDILLHTKTPELNLIVKDIMQSSILTCPPETKINVAASRMRARNISSIIIKSNLTLGIWTESDCRKIDFSDQEQFNVSISELMNSPVLTIKQDIQVNELAIKFRHYGVRHFIVVDADNLPVGIVSQTDVIKNQGIEHYLQAKLVASSYKKTNNYCNMIAA